MAQRRKAAWLCLAASALIVGGCSSQTSPAAAADHRPRRRGRRRRRAPPSTTPGPPSAVPTTVLAPVSPAPGWTEAADRAPPGGGFTSLSCLSDTFCIAAGGGTSGDPSELTSGSGVAESWDGAAWSEPSVYYPAPATGPVTAPVLPAVACTSGPSCLIADGSGHVSDGNGTDWSTPMAMPAGTVDAVQPGRPGGPGTPGRGRWRCRAPRPPSAPSWTTPARPTSWPRPLAGPAVVRDAGRYGATVSLYQPGRVGVSCPTSSACTAVVGASVLAGTAPAGPRSRAVDLLARLGGVRPHRHLLPHHLAVRHRQRHRGVDGRPGGPVVGRRDADPDGGLDSISCPSATFCLAAGSSGSVVTWNGASWTAPDQVIPSADRVPGHRHVRVVPERPVLHGHQRRRRLRHLLGVGVPVVGPGRPAPTAHVEV